MNTSDMTRFEKCRHCMPDLSNERVTFMCTKRNEEINEEICQKCNEFKSRYIEYPIEVNFVNIKNINDSYRKDDIGKPVRVRPCGDEYCGKTYVGIYLGDLFMQNTVSYRRDTMELSVIPITNPAMFVPELNKIIYGAESWWSIIKSGDDISDITNNEINNQWYMQLLSGIYKRRDDNN